MLRRPGGAKRDRTADLLRARQALSQLSYSPNVLGFSWFGLSLFKTLLKVFFVAWYLVFAKRASAREQALNAKIRKSGGSGQIRTADLTLIRGAL